jgi:hypothetical protein
MELLPKYLQQLIWKQLWKANIKEVHQELINKKINFVCDLVKFKNNIDPNAMGGKKLSLDLNNYIYKTKYIVHMIPESIYFAKSIVMSSCFGLYETEDWITEISEIFVNIARSKRWIELPSPYVIDDGQRIYFYM